MYRIIATLTPGHDILQIAFIISAFEFTSALEAAIVAMRQLGFHHDDFELTCFEHFGGKEA